MEVSRTKWGPEFIVLNTNKDKEKNYIMQSMTRSMSLNFNSKRPNNHQQPTEDLEAFDSGETVALKNFCWFNIVPPIPVHLRRDG